MRQSSTFTKLPQMSCRIRGEAPAPALAAASPSDASCAAHASRLASDVASGSMGMRSQLAGCAASTSSGMPVLSEPNTRKSPSRYVDSAYVRRAFFVSRCSWGVSAGVAPSAARPFCRRNSSQPA